MSELWNYMVNGYQKKYLTTVKGDLSQVTAPPFILSPKSVVELPAAWAEHQSIFLAPATEPVPAKRALFMLKNFVVSLKSQQYTNQNEEGIKKPLNAFLGELFIGEYHGDKGVTKVIAEQVSHHPPVTACYMYNKEVGIRAEAYIGEETTFSPMHGITVKQNGHTIFHIDEYKEDHLITMPTLVVKGLLSGSPYPELSGTCYITSSSGYTSKIDFDGKSSLGSGKKNSLSAVLYHNDHPERPLYQVTGHWNKMLTFYDGANQCEMETVDVDTLPKSEFKMASVEKQDPWESRRAWSPVIAAINDRNMQAVSAEKEKLEGGQRAMRQREQEQGTVWRRRFFVQENSHARAERLAAAIGHRLDPASTAGIWRFIGIEAAEKIHKPFHDGLLPVGSTS